MTRPYTLILALLVLGLVACGDAPEPASSDARDSAPAPQTSTPDAEPQPVATKAAEDLISADSLMAHIRTLASDEFGGRAPMSEGEALTLDYLETQFRQAGLEPMFGDSYRQSVSLVSIEADPETVLTVSGGESEVPQVYAYGPQVVYGSAQVVEETGLVDSELVWVGYGIVAPEFGWNDYAGLDMTGKTAVILVNDPGFATGNPGLFNGKAMTYYGRWTYKYEEAARQGAAGALIVHQTEPAAYGWNVVEGGWTGPQFHLAPEDGNQDRLALEGWVRFDVAEEILARAGADIGALGAQALEGNAGSRPLGVKVSAPIRNTLEFAESYNIGAVLPGSGAPEELFVYMAHWDHMGTSAHEPGTEGDFIYNGAEDNASGTAALLELGRAFAATTPRPRRTVGFLAVTAEESGLLGSMAYAADPAYPMNRTVAGLNMDRLNFIGPMTDVVVIGHGSSEMEDVLATAAAEQSRSVTPEATPEKGFYYRSDHFNFAKKGVPVLYARGGTTHRKLGAQYVTGKNAEYVAERYHSPADEVQDDWDVDAAVEDLRLFYRVGLAVAGGAFWPSWYEGNEFRAIREESLAE